MKFVYLKLRHEFYRQFVETHLPAFCLAGRNNLVVECIAETIIPSSRSY